MNVAYAGRTCQVWSQLSDVSQVGQALSRRSPSCNTKETGLSHRHHVQNTSHTLGVTSKEKQRKPKCMQSGIYFPALAHLCFSFLTSTLGFLGGGGLESDESFLTKGNICLILKQIHSRDSEHIKHQARHALAVDKELFEGVEPHNHHVSHPQTGNFHTPNSPTFLSWPHQSAF